ncbi:MAG TPA: CobD/CbiB family protein [Burkholderiales bacterium]|nr:CobD/CbiB family protein [Burkholderiales bacterium]
MSVIAIVAALILEQWRPLGERKAYSAWLSAAAGWIERTFHATEGRNGALAWALAVLPPAAAAIVLHAALYRLSPLLALLFNVGVLYLTLGFRQFSHSFTELQTALKGGELERARELISGWRGEPTLPREREEVIRLTVEEAILAAHRHVFGVIFWYVVLPGPSGALAYRLAAFVRQRWSTMGSFGGFAERAVYLLEWPAVRLTAAAFAVVGDFEDALYCWRTQARGWLDGNAGVLLAAAAGAMGVRLGMPVQEAGGVQPRPELGLGARADIPTLDSTVGLLWRAVVMWVFVLLVFALAQLVS